MSMLRQLTPLEHARLRELLELLHAERAEGEPAHDEQRLQTRVEKLRESYADVFALIAKEKERYK